MNTCIYPLVCLYIGLFSIVYPIYKMSSSTYTKPEVWVYNVLYVTDPVSATKPEVWVYNVLYFTDPVSATKPEVWVYNVLYVTDPPSATKPEVRVSITDDLDACDQLSVHRPQHRTTYCQERWYNKTYTHIISLTILCLGFLKKLICCCHLNDHIYHRTTSP